MARKHVLFAGEVFEKLQSRRQPSSEMEALMQTVPGEEPEPSAEELLELREAVAEAIASLPQKYRTVIELLMYKRLSLKEAGNVMGYSDVHILRLRNTAYDKLRNTLTMNNELRRRYEMATTWDQSAAQWCAHLGPLSKPNNKIDFKTLHDRIDALIGITFHNNLEPNPDAFVAIATPVVSYLRANDSWDSAQMAKLLSYKQHDYGHGNILRFGLKGIVVRLTDKYERLANLQFTKDFLEDGGTTAPLVSETISDTLHDIIGYCVVGLMVLDDTFKLSLGEEYGVQANNSRV
jgi:hypothetical protein